MSGEASKALSSEDLAAKSKTIQVMIGILLIVVAIGMLVFTFMMIGDLVTGSTINKLIVEVIRVTIMVLIALFVLSKGIALIRVS